ncbi:hypothetical protein Kfla_0704 [Kribbella flavida DSM 17836]|uniref:Uncharacterized protein n=1 Tax=Kribbella flavida (strain DSM 17836 / JCM 10339 / NBRC 14399) TaxID=479435 RepID=D2PXH7_KRIFD|nr:hypothetical protein [Kribbella flavida]ADB29825.1 hypothetical protein Kfla_0704 [Kribbella flavida DSM 17836]
MTTNPIPAVPPVGPGSDPQNPDLVDPGLDQPDVGTRPGDDSPLSQPVSTPESDPDENPDDQLPRS